MHSTLTGKGRESRKSNFIPGNHSRGNSPGNPGNTGTWVPGRETLLAAFVGPGGRFNFIKLSLLNDLLESVNLITYAYIKRLACSFIDFV